MLLTTLALVAALQQPVAPAQVASGSAAAPAAAPAADASKPVCRRITSTGSRLGGEKVCLTAQQWRDRERDDAQSLDNLQNRSHNGFGPG